jgi:hypothetical protein
MRGELRSNRVSRGITIANEGLLKKGAVNST